MAPSSCRITSGDPFFAQARAQSRLMGLLNPFVNAQAESKTQPVTVFCSLFWGAANTSEPVAMRTAKAAKRLVIKTSHLLSRLRGAVDATGRVYLQGCPKSNSAK